MRLVWSQLASRQVDEALAYIVADDAAAARRWLDELLERVEALRRLPDADGSCPSSAATSSVSSSSGATV